MESIFGPCVSITILKLNSVDLTHKQIVGSQVRKFEKSHYGSHFIMVSKRIINDACSTLIEIDGDHAQKSQPRGFRS